MTALDKLRQAKEFLSSAGIEDADREAEIIIAHSLGMERMILYRDNPQIPDDVISKIDELLMRRAKREPFQYILGYAEFYGLKIKVGQGVLIPRPETELLVEEAVKLATDHKSRIATLRMIDLCTGSGCIALALAKEFPEARVYGTDTSDIAIRYAEENAMINGIKNAVFLKGSLFESIRENLPDRDFDLVVSNPPYIKREDISSLQPEVSQWEPEEALDGGEDGLDYYRIIIPEARNYLTPQGFLILEIGIGQAAEIRKMASDAGFRVILLIKDYAGIERILIASVV